MFAAQSKRDLEWFFDDWVYRDRGLPDFRIVSVYPRQTLQNTYLVTVTVENLGEAGAEVPVMAPYQGIETTERMQIKGKSRNSVRLQMATAGRGHGERRQRSGNRFYQRHCQSAGSAEMTRVGKISFVYLSVLSD